jgi:3-hydroxyisobutyrate dehydrogenase-like beta-hydroxyacid dehydrogenase
MVADDQALKTITEGHDGILGRLGEGGVHLSMSTVSPELARRLADVHAAIGELYVSAPVFGRPDAAVAGQLWICVSGNPDAVHRVMPILQTAGQGVFQFGRDPGMALVAKLAGNTLIVAAIEAMAEAYALAERHGLDPQALADVFNGTFLACPVYRNYGRMIAAKRFSPTGMRLALGLKDTSMALDLAHARQVPMPILSLVHDRLLASVSKGRGEIDWAGLALETFEACGIIVTAEDPPPGTT